LARLNSVVAAPISVGLVFCGKKLSASVASYGDPTPWQPISAVPREDWRALHSWGPMISPIFPGSVEPRAKIRNTDLQGPFMRSLDVSTRVWRVERAVEDWMEESGSGFVATVERKAAIATI